MEEINWCNKFKGREQEEYELNQRGQRFALCNGDYVPQDFIDLYNSLKIMVWEGTITEKQMADSIQRSLEE